jgi:hypothetical protein
MYQSSGEIEEPSYIYTEAASATLARRIILASSYPAILSDMLAIREDLMAGPLTVGLGLPGGNHFVDLNTKNCYTEAKLRRQRIRRKVCFLQYLQFSRVGQLMTKCALKFGGVGF